MSVDLSISVPPERFFHVLSGPCVCAKEFCGMMIIQLTCDFLKVGIVEDECKGEKSAGMYGSQHIGAFFSFP